MSKKLQWYHSGYRGKLISARYYNFIFDIWYQDDDDRQKPYGITYSTMIPLSRSELGSTRFPRFENAVMRIVEITRMLDRQGYRPESEEVI